MRDAVEHRNKRGRSGGNRVYTLHFVDAHRQRRKARMPSCASSSRRRSPPSLPPCARLSFLWDQRTVLYRGVFRILKRNPFCAIGSACSRSTSTLEIERLSTMILASDDPRFSSFDLVIFFGYTIYYRDKYLCFLSTSLILSFERYYYLFIDECKVSYHTNNKHLPNL